MNETASRMKSEIRLIAGYRALIISKYYLTVLLSLLTLYLAHKNYSVSSLYVLLFLNILPSILVYALKDYAKKYDYKILRLLTEESEFKLCHLKSKYQYSKVRYYANSISYLIALLLMSLWQMSYSRSINHPPLLEHAPMFILITGLLLRFWGILFYRFRFPYLLRHNKL